MEITWLGHASVKVKSAGIVVYADPCFGEEYDEPADLVLLTHPAYDHFSREKIMRVRTDRTILFGPSSVAHELFGVSALSPGDVREEPPMKVMACAAHGKQNVPDEGIGYLLKMEGKTLYFAGDTWSVPDMKGITCDFAFLPIGGTYTMGPVEAARMVSLFSPRAIIPIHYGSGIEGSVDNARYFKELVEEKGTTTVVVMERGSTLSF